MLEPGKPETALSNPQELVGLCDQNWQRALGWLKSGTIETCLRTLGQSSLLQLAYQARQESDLNLGLERLLQAAGAPPPPAPAANSKEVLNALGYGLFPSRKKPPAQLELILRHAGGRGYLSGSVTALVPWLQVPQPGYGCLPGESAPITLLVDRAAWKKQAFVLRARLLEIAW